MLLPALLLSSAFATPAFAQDEAAPGFGGFRIEAVTGVDIVGSDLDDQGGSKNALLFGLGVGYDFDLGGAIVGVEGEISDSGVEECVQNVVEDDDEVCVGTGRDLYLGLRAGTQIGSNMLIYAKAGYSNAGTTFDYDEGSDEDTSLDEGAVEDELDLPDFDGIRLGAGVEYAITSGAFMKGEYRYSNYEDGVDRHQFAIGLGLRF